MSASEQVIVNAKYAKNAVVELDRKLQEGSAAHLWEYFHLRPTENGIGIVCNHPRYAMQCAEVATEALAEKLQLLKDNAVGPLAAEAPGEEQLALLADTMHGLGFHPMPWAEDSNVGRQRKEHIQAAFISGMIRGGAEYGGVRFLASDLILPDVENGAEHRFDTVGLKDGTLYLFKLYRGRAAEVYDQAAEYRRYYDAHQEAFEKLLAAYPRTACHEVVSVHVVRSVAVMKYAADSSEDWQAKSNAAGVDTWFFEPSVSFRKLLAR